MTRTRIDLYDLTGAALAIALIGWVCVTALLRTGNPLPQVVTLAAAAAAYVVGRSQGGRRPVFVAAVVVVAILAGVVLSGPASISGGALAPPLGYANANGALYTLGTAAAAIVAVATNKVAVKQPAAMLAIVMVTFAAFTGSEAGIALSIGVLTAALAARMLGRWVALVAPVVVAGPVMITVVLGLRHGSSAFPELVERLTDRRTELWHDAIDIVGDQPVLGVGPGMFGQTSPTALGDADAAWAHSAYLEVAAEHGIPGVLLLGAILLWVYGGLYRSRQNPRVVVIGVAATTAFAIHAAIDYVAHFPAVVLVAALIAGLASSTRPTEPPS
jgi:O-antigen ligase